jgi:hypothetical protein
VEVYSWIWEREKDQKSRKTKKSKTYKKAKGLSIQPSGITAALRPAGISIKALIAKFFERIRDASEKKEFITMVRQHARLGLDNLVYSKEL